MRASAFAESVKVVPRLPLHPYIPVVASTSTTFCFDEYWNWLLDSRSTTASSGTLFWHGQITGAEAVNLTNRNHVYIEKWPSYSSLGPHRPIASAMVTIDANAIFDDANLGFRSTPLLTPSYWSIFVNANAATDAMTGAQSEATIAVEHDDQLPAELTAEYGPMMKVIHDSKLWSWRELSQILGPSHTYLQRIARGEASANHDIGGEISKLHRFLTAARKVTRNNRTALQRALRAPRERDTRSANDHLRSGHFQKAFSAIMDAVSRRPTVANVTNVPLRWYDDPSRAVASGRPEDGVD